MSCKCEGTVGAGVAEMLTDAANDLLSAGIRLDGASDGTCGVTAGYLLGIGTSIDHLAGQLRKVAAEVSA